MPWGARSIYISVPCFLASGYVWLIEDTRKRLESGRKERGQRVSPGNSPTFPQRCSCLVAPLSGLQLSQSFTEIAPTQHEGCKSFPLLLVVGCLNVPFWFPNSAHTSQAPAKCMLSPVGKPAVTLEPSLYMCIIDLAGSLEHRFSTSALGFRLDNPLLQGVDLSIVGCVAASLVPTC